MIKLTFTVTGGAEPRDILVAIHEPIKNPHPGKWPWVATVDVEGRSYTTYGMDPLDAVENACQHAARLLRGVYDDNLDPLVAPRA